MKPETFDKLYEKVTSHFTNNAKKMYVFDGLCGANPATQKKVRFVTENAWQSHFVTNMFIRPTAEQLEDFEPDFTIINGCATQNENYKADGLNSEVFVSFNIEKNVAIIGGTWYGGEMKKVRLFFIFFFFFDYLVKKSLLKIIIYLSILMF